MARTLIGNIKGPKGNTGEQGPQGVQGIQGNTGPTGATGKGLIIRGHYDTEDALKASVTAPEIGDGYYVGAGKPYDVYTYTDSGWFNQGPLLSDYGAYIEQSASGSIASFDDGADGVPVKDLTVRIEPVQEGSGDPSPENVRPITGWTGVNIYRGKGDNLADFTKIAAYERTSVAMVDGGVRVASSSAGTYRSAYLSSKNIGLNAGRTYRVTFRAEVRKGTGAVAFRNESTKILVRGNSGAFTESGDYSFTTALSDAANIGLFFFCTYSKSESGDITYTDIAVEEFTPVDVPFGDAGTVYGGTLDVTTGVLTVTMNKITLTTDMGLSISKSSVTGADIYIVGTDTSRTQFHHAGALSSALCNRFQFTNVVDSTQVGTFFTSVSGNGLRDQFRFTFAQAGTTDVDDFTEFLQNNEVQVVYSLAAPLTYQLSPTEVTTLLGVNNIYADTGSVNVAYRADPTISYNKLKAAILSLGGNV